MRCLLGVEPSNGFQSVILFSVSDEKNNWLATHIWARHFRHGRHFLMAEKFWRLPELFLCSVAGDLQNIFPLVILFFSRPKKNICRTNVSEVQMVIIKIFGSGQNFRCWNFWRWPEFSPLTDQTCDYLVVSEETWLEKPAGAATDFGAEARGCNAAGVVSYAVKRRRQFMDSHTFRLCRSQTLQAARGRTNGQMVA